MGGSRWLARGAAAGAAGTTALNAVTYLDMVLRARPASSTPSDTVERLSGLVGVDVPGEGEERQNRVDGLAPLLGLATGVGVGVLLGAARAVGWRPRPWTEVLVASAVALVGANAPMTALGISDPRSWSAPDWVADVIPHLAYGIVAAGTLHAMADKSRSVARQLFSSG